MEWMRRLGFVVLAGLSGCATTAPASQVEVRGWLTDYPPLEADRPGVLYWSAPGAKAGDFRAISLAPVETWPPDVEPDEAAARAEFAALLEATLRQRLGERFELVDAAAPGVLRLRCAVTEVERAAIVSGHAFHRGRASVEAELLDGADGRRRAVAIARRLGAKTARLNPGQPEDARAIAEEWASGLVEHLQRGGLPTRPDAGPR